MASMWEGALRRFTRRKPVTAPRKSGHQLARNLTVAQLIPIGIGSTIGAGVYVLIGTVARERAGPSLILSFLIAGIAAALSAFCYAELASRCPSAGSAYHYAYICVGEGVAWIIGWGLVLEYTVGGSTVARGISPNLAIFFGGADKLPAIFMRREIPGLGIIVDPCAGLIVILVTILLCIGIKESANVTSVMVAANVSVLLFVIVAGTWAGFSNGWPGYETVDSYFPFGVNGTLAGAATLFFAFIGFDTVASTAEEVKNPKSDLPVGIALSLFICASLYMLVSMVVVGLVPYNLMDPDTPMSNAFSENGMPWAMYIVAAGATAALSTTLMGSLLPQPRILMAMARDGLLPPFFSTISKTTFVPVNGTVLSGFVACLMAFLMDVDQLSGMVSVGTLLAFTVVSVSILILRYVPPADLAIRSRLPAQASPLSSSAAARLLSRPLEPAPVNKSHAYLALPAVYEADLTPAAPSLFSDAPLQTSPGMVADPSSTSIEVADHATALGGADEEDPRCPIDIKALQGNRLLIIDGKPDKLQNEKRRLAATIAISFVCVGVLLISLATSGGRLPIWFRWALGTFGVPLFVAGSVVLCLIDQDEERLNFGDTGGFMCPFVPALPLASILINVYLLVTLGIATWLRVSVWLVIGIFIYLFYGLHHSNLTTEVVHGGSSEAPLPLASHVLH